MGTLPSAGNTLTTKGNIERPFSLFLHYRLMLKTQTLRPGSLCLKCRSTTFWLSNLKYTNWTSSCFYLLSWKQNQIWGESICLRIKRIIWDDHTQHIILLSQSKSSTNNNSYHDWKFLFVKNINLSKHLPLLQLKSVSILDLERNSTLLTKTTNGAVVQM